MEVTLLPDEDDATPAFPSALRQRQMEAVMREFERWQRAKEREDPSMSDKAFAFRMKRLLED